MVEFVYGMKRTTLNLENENVKVIVFDGDTQSKNEIL